jgi:hypothetical protein
LTSVNRNIGNQSECRDNMAMAAEDRGHRLNRCVRMRDL